MKVINWLITLCGLWEFGDIAALFVPNFGDIEAFVWNHIIVGFVLMIVGAWAAMTSHADTAKTMHCVAATSALWLIIAPFILGRPAMAAGLWNDITVGVIALLLSIWAVLISPRVAE